MGRCNENNVGSMLDFLLNSPCEEEIVDMECNDYCDRIARLAELVADGAKLAHLRPALEKHIQHWRDCREEFEALVAIIEAETNGDIAEIDALIAQAEQTTEKEDKSQ